MATRYCELVRADDRYDTIDKPDGSPVTIADIGSQIIINHSIKTAFPADLIVGEEDESVSVDMSLIVEYYEQLGISIPDPHSLLHRHPMATGVPFWTVDPVDGTKGFLKRGPDGGQYAVCCAYINAHGEPILSVMAGPRLDAHGIIMYSVSGGGCFYSSLDDPSSFKRCMVDTTSQILCASCESSHTRPGVIEHIAAQCGLHIFRADSQVKYMLVAMGSASAYLRVPPPTRQECIWDHAPGELLVREAGGCVTDDKGQRLVFPSSGNMDGAVWAIVACADEQLSERIRAELDALKLNYDQLTE